MKNPKTLLRVGVVGTVLAALCCFTPILAILLGAVGLAALTGYLDYVLLPALVSFAGLTLYAVRRKHDADACCAVTRSREGK
ncbi:MAG: mercury resistance system transport protein MerF [Erythrobacter tepidarius]